MTFRDDSATLDAARLRFLRDCYREDHRAQAILDVFASKVERRVVLDSAGRAALDAGTPLDEASPIHPVAQAVRLYRAEKIALVGRLLVVGRTLGGDGDDGGQVVCAPLWFTPVEAVASDDAGAPALSLVGERTYPNHPLLSLLGDLHGVEPGALEQFERSLPRPDEATGDEADAAFLAATTERFSAVFDGLVVDPSPDAPITTSAALGRQKRAASRRDLGDSPARLTLCRADLLLLVRQAIDTRGVSYELASLADAIDAGTELSPPVRVLFDRPVPPRSESSIQDPGGEVPAILSGAQRRALDSAAHETLSLVVGPPGTGKSFTIAAIALDALSRGESVLIAAKTDAAVDVVAQKVETLLGGSDAVVRGGRRGYGKALKRSLHDLVHYGVDVGPPERATGLREARRDLDAWIDELAVTLARRSGRETRWGELDAALDRGGWRPVDRVAWWLLGSLLGRSTAYWTLMERYRAALDERVRLQGEQLRDGMKRRLDALLRDQRQALVRLAKSIGARTVDRRDRLWDQLDADVLLHALPVWLVKLADVSGVLPLVGGLFDVVILDEATQCDLASSVPVLQRGRRAVVVGDPKQLRHLSFLARARQGRLGDHHGLGRETIEALDYRDQSVLDRVDAVLTTQDGVAHLDEHFRSVPAIIEFSNREFYGDRLKVMQEHPAHDYRRALYLHRVDGRREPGGVNRAEAEALVARVVELVTASQPRDAAPTLGVLSPFRAQVEHLGELLDAALDDHALVRHDVRVGTPYAFQGAERDIMFLSFALDTDAHPSAFRYLERADVFNVAVTRARNRQEVFVSLDATAPVLARCDLLRRFLDHMREDGLSPPPRSVDDPFLVAVRHRLEVEGFRAWPAYAIAGLEVDLVVERRGACLGIDLVGHPGAFAGAFELERYRVFNRAGLRLLPLPWSAWRRDENACVEAIDEVALEIERGRGAGGGGILKAS